MRLEKVDLAHTPITTDINTLFLRLVSAAESIADNQERQTAALESLAESQRRLADAKAPQCRIVGSRYVANRTGHTTQWVREQIESGKLPTTCIAQRAKDGGYWKFHGDKIDQWIDQL